MSENGNQGRPLTRRELRERERAEQAAHGEAAARGSGAVPVSAPPARPSVRPVPGASVPGGRMPGGVVPPASVPPASVPGAAAPPASVPSASVPGAAGGAGRRADRTSAPTSRRALRQSAAATSEPTGSVVRPPSGTGGMRSLDATGRLTPVHETSDQVLVRPPAAPTAPPAGRAAPPRRVPSTPADHSDSTSGSRAGAPGRPDQAGGSHRFAPAAAPQQAVETPRLSSFGRQGAPGAGATAVPAAPPVDRRSATPVPPAVPPTSVPPAAAPGAAPAPAASGYTIRAMGVRDVRTGAPGSPANAAGAPIQVPGSVGRGAAMPASAGVRPVAGAPVSVPPAGAVPGSVAPGSVVPGSVVPGSRAPGLGGPGAIPPGGKAPGSVPPGAIPPGAIPPGAIPPGGKAPGARAPGSVPPGSAAPAFGTPSGRGAPPGSAAIVTDDTPAAGMPWTSVRGGGMTTPDPRSDLRTEDTVVAGSMPWAAVTAGSPVVPAGGSAAAGRAPTDSPFPAVSGPGGEAAARDRTGDRPRTAARRGPSYTWLHYIILLAVAFVLGMLIWKLIVKPAPNTEGFGVEPQVVASAMALGPGGPDGIGAP